jgi:hypothetical protein
VGVRSSKSKGADTHKVASPWKPLSHHLRKATLVLCCGQMELLTLCLPNGLKVCTSCTEALINSLKLLRMTELRMQATDWGYVVTGSTKHGPA